MADIQFNLRIPEELKEQIKEAATKSGRSINAEAQMRLEESFKRTPSTTSLAELIALQEETIQYMKQLHEQNAELSKELIEEKNRNEARFKDLNVLRGLEAVRKRPGIIDFENVLSADFDKDDPDKNYLVMNKKKGK